MYATKHSKRSYISPSYRTSEALPHSVVDANMIKILPLDEQWIDQGIICKFNYYCELTVTGGANLYMTLFAIRIPVPVCSHWLGLDSV